MKSVLFYDVLIKKAQTWYILHPHITELLNVADPKVAYRGSLLPHQETKIPLTQDGLERRRTLALATAGATVWPWCGTTYLGHEAGPWWRYVQWPLQIHARKAAPQERSINFSRLLSPNPAFWGKGTPRR
jgi:hypothetical protein